MSSMVFPAITIHSIVKIGTKVIQPHIIKKIPKFGRFAPALMGLASIPFIIHPLDMLGTEIMNRTVRPYYRDLIDIPKH